MRLSETNLSNGIYTQATLEYVDNGVIQTLTGPFELLAECLQLTFRLNQLLDDRTGAGQRLWSLETALTDQCDRAPSRDFHTT